MDLCHTPAPLQSLFPGRAARYRLADPAYTQDRAARQPYRLVQFSCLLADRPGVSAVDMVGAYRPVASTGQPAARLACGRIYSAQMGIQSYLVAYPDTGHFVLGKSAGAHHAGAAYLNRPSALSHPPYSSQSGGDRKSTRLNSS